MIEKISVSEQPTAVTVEVVEPPEGRVDAVVPPPPDVDVAPEPGDAVVGGTAVEVPQAVAKTMSTASATMIRRGRTDVAGSAIIVTPPVRPLRTVPQPTREDLQISGD
jgi:hypothetical protein